MELGLLFILPAVFLVSCQESNTTNSNKNDPTSVLKVDTLQEAINKLDTTSNTSKANSDTSQFFNSIDTFKDFPAEIDGCSCYFSPNQQSFRKQEYLYVASFDSIAFISINKKMIKLKLISTTRELETFGDADHVDIFFNDNFKVTVDTKYKKSTGEETWFNTGTITIETKDGRKATKIFYGECGC